MIYYLAYGSNLHPLRLTNRVPSAKLVGPSKIYGYKLVFNKRGRDGSAKCSFIYKEGVVLYGAVYSIAHEEKAILDRIEDLGGGYAERQFSVRCNGNAYDCFTYQAQPAFIDNSIKPYHWYKQLVLLGAKHLGLPEDHIFSIASHPSVADPDERRKEKNVLLIERISGFMV